MTRAAPLENLRRAFRRDLYLPDAASLEVSVATAVAHLMGEDLWVHLVGPSGAGKTEVIRSLDGLGFVHPLSSLTSHTLFSGSRPPTDDRGREVLSQHPSLLTRMAHQRPPRSFLTMKDFTTVLTMHRDDRSEIMGQLREVYDGSYVRELGNGRTVAWRGRVGLLTGVTPVIDSYRSVMSVLGERFLYLRLADVDRTQLAARAMAHRDEDEMRLRLRRAVSRFVRHVPLDAELPAEDRLYVVQLATVASWVRTGVVRDEYRLEVQARPQLDAPTRMARQLSALHRALAAMGHEDPRALVQRVARDSVPRDRWDALFLLLAEDLTTRQVCDGLRVPRTQYKSVRRMLEDLEMLRLIDVRREQQEGRAMSDGDDDSFAPNTYSLTDEARLALVPILPHEERRLEGAA